MKEIIFIIMKTVCILFGLFIHGFALKCHKCISVSCPEQPAFCSAVNEFAFKQLPDYYYYMDNGIEFCPDAVDAQDDWDHLKISSSYLPCGEDKEGEATCTVGRFRIVTLITDLQKNITTYGTVMGCAKRKLLESTREALKQRNECGMLAFASPVRNSLKHYMELEHCPMISEMCHDQDYCIKPEMSIVKTFKDVQNGGSNTVAIFIGVFILLGVLIAALTFAGIKYNS